MCIHLDAHALSLTYPRHISADKLGVFVAVKRYKRAVPLLFGGMCLPICHLIMLFAVSLG